ncbi:MAG: hypothetical protein EBQ64_03415 [Acidimicrobiia bacterium]|nr:hypothetical protein [Acidimicrobiia bacterium]
MFVNKVIVAVTISPCSSKKRTTSAGVRFNFGANSCDEQPRSITTMPSGGGVALGVYVVGACGNCSSNSRRRSPRVFLRGPRR